MGTIEDSLPRRFRRYSDCTLQRSRRNLLGHSPRARHRPTARDGDAAFHSLLRPERLRTDADLQRRLHHALSRRGASLAAVALVRRLGCDRDRYSRRRCTAARHSGEGTVTTDDRTAYQRCASVTHSAAFSPLARWLRSPIAGSLVVEERL